MDRGPHEPSGGRGTTPRGRAADRPDWDTPLLEHLSERDRRLFQVLGEGPLQAVPQLLLHRAFERWAAVLPEATAVEHGTEKVTYGELDRRAEAVAAHLMAHGVRPGDRVVLFVVRSVLMVVGILGILKAGAAYVPQDAAEPTDLRRVVRLTGTRIVVTLSGLQRTLTGLRAAVLTLDRPTTWSPRSLPAELSWPERPPPIDADACVVVARGPGGSPLGVRLTHRNLCNLTLGRPEQLGVGPGWRVGQLNEIDAVLSAWEIFGALANGGTLVLPFEDPATAVAGIDVALTTPQLLARVGPRHGRRLKVLAVAGACPRPLAARWAATCAVYSITGTAETTLLPTVQRLHRGTPPLAIGRPSPNNTVYVLDERRRPCAIGEIGEAWAGGDCVSPGYLGDQTLNAVRFTPDPFLGSGRAMFGTRALCRWSADGELEYLGDDPEPDITPPGRPR